VDVHKLLTRGLIQTVIVVGDKASICAYSVIACKVFAVMFLEFCYFLVIVYSLHSFGSHNSCVAIE